MTKLFLITAASVFEDTVLDQFVEAETPEQALELWKAGDLYGDLGEHEGDVYVHEVPTLTGFPHCFQWCSPEVPRRIEIIAKKDED